MNVPNQYPTNVLIAEDDDEDYLIFSLAIEELSFKVILSRAENGDILFKLLDENNPDIVFLDLLMPCKDGRQCLREIRANRKYGCHSHYRIFFVKRPAEYRILLP